MSDGPSTLGCHGASTGGIALGLFAFVALMLAAEGALFLWISDRLAGAMPARSPRQLAGPGGTRRRRRADPRSRPESRYLSRRSIRGRCADVLRRPSRRPRRLQSRRCPRRNRGGAARRNGADRRARRTAPRPQTRGSRASASEATARRGVCAPAGPDRGRSARWRPCSSTMHRWGAWSSGPGIGRSGGSSGSSDRPMAVIAATVLGVGTALIALVVFGPVRRRLRGAGRDGTSGRRRSLGARPRTWRRRGGGARPVVQPDGRRAGARAGARGVGSHAPAADGGCLARADDAADRDARLRRNADDAGAAARSADAPALHGDRHRRNAPARADHRRPARSGPARGAA